MIDPVSISEAAGMLKLTPGRVRVMAAHGQLGATKVGEHWLVERAEVERRRSEGGHEGRRFAPHNAWVLLLLASGEDVVGVDPSVRSRLKRGLEREGLQGLGPRLGTRARVLSFRAHPGEVAHLFDDPALVRSGISAAGSEKGFGLVSGREVDGYLKESMLKKFVAKHALVPVGRGGNVRLRLVPDSSWRFLAKRGVAPPAAVALDLAEDPEARSSQAGRRALRKLDRRRPAFVKARRRGGGR